MAQGRSEATSMTARGLATRAETSRSSVTSGDWGSSFGRRTEAGAAGSVYARGSFRRGFAADAEASEDAKKAEDAHEPSPRMVRLADDICGLTLLEVHDLTTILKKRLGLDAMPMMGMPMGGAAMGGAPAAGGGAFGAPAQTTPGAFGAPAGGGAFGAAAGGGAAGASTNSSILGAQSCDPRVCHAIPSVHVLEATANLDLQKRNHWHCRDGLGYRDSGRLTRRFGFFLPIEQKNRENMTQPVNPRKGGSRTPRIVRPRRRVDRIPARCRCQSRGSRVLPRSPAPSRRAARANPRTPPAFPEAAPAVIRLTGGTTEKRRARRLRPARASSPRV